MKFVFLTNDGKLVDKYTGTYVEVLREVSQAETEVRFFDGETAVINPKNLYAPDCVPFKVGDKVKNLKEFTLNSGALAWSGITWEIKQVTYDLPDLSDAVLVCDSQEVGLFGKVFLSDQVEKVEKI